MTCAAVAAVIVIYLMTSNAATFDGRFGQWKAIKIPITKTVYIPVRRK